MSGYQASKCVTVYPVASSSKPLLESDNIEA